MYYYKNNEAKKEFIRRNATAIAADIARIAEFQNISADGNGIEAISYYNVLSQMEEAQKKIACLAAAYEINTCDALDAKDYQIINALIMYNDLIIEESGESIL